MGDKKSRWDYLGKEPSELIEPAKKESENKVSNEINITKEKIVKVLQSFATKREWQLIPPDKGLYELKSQLFLDARLFAGFDVSPGGTSYLHFIFLLGGINNESYAYNLIKMNAGGFGGSPFFLTIKEIEEHKFLRLESWFVIPKDASDEAMINALHGAFDTLFTTFIMTPWEKLMKMGIDIFLFPESMQRK